MIQCKSTLANKFALLHVTSSLTHLFSVYEPFLLNLILEDRKRMKRSRIDGVSGFCRSQLGKKRTHARQYKPSVDGAGTILAAWLFADLSISLLLSLLLFSLVPPQFSFRGVGFTACCIVVRIKLPGRKPTPPHQKKRRRKHPKLKVELQLLVRLITRHEVTSERQKTWKA